MTSENISELLSVQAVFDLACERIDYWNEVRNAKFAPELTHFGCADMIPEVMHFFYVAYPKELVTRPEAERPSGKTWYSRAMNVDEFEEDDLIYTYEYWKEQFDRILEPIANTDPTLDSKKDADEDKVQEA